MGTSSVDQRHEIEATVARLVGLKLSQTRRATSTRVLHFGELHIDGERSWGTWALHLSCPWRLDGPEGTVTGSEDLGCRIESPENRMDRRWDYDSGGNLQDHLFGELLGEVPGRAGSLRNLRDDMVVESIAVSDAAGLTIQLSGGYRLEVFPAGTREESWRMFAPDSEDPHFVIVGTVIEPVDAP